MVVVNEVTYDGQLFLRLSIVEMGLLTKVFGRGTGGFSFPNDLLLWWWGLLGGFLSELEWNGVVDVSHWSRSLARWSQR